MKYVCLELIQCAFSLPCLPQYTHFLLCPFLSGVCAGETVPSGLEENLCKICMDSPIDCVLLECGHMVTCTKCGKRMNECPICRQYVIRAVHVFRS
jgi:hypothetical protein